MPHPGIQTPALLPTVEAAKMSDARVLALEQAPGAKPPWTAYDLTEDLQPAEAARRRGFAGALLAATLHASRQLIKLQVVARQRMASRHALGRAFPSAGLTSGGCVPQGGGEQVPGSCAVPSLRPRDPVPAGVASPLLYDWGMIETTEELAGRIAARGLPDSVVQIATRGGATLHPELDHHTRSVDLSPDGPAATVVREHGTEDWVPLWQDGTTTVFSLPDGSFVQFSAEDDEAWETWDDFAGAVRFVLTDMYEGEAQDEDREAVAALLLPPELRAQALEPEER